MIEKTVKVNISFQSLLDTVSSLKVSEKHQLLEHLEAELFADDEDTESEMSEIKAARQEYQAGEYITFDRYLAQRENRSR
jgi:hypothetical protein